MSAAQKRVFDGGGKILPNLVVQTRTENNVTPWQYKNVNPAAEASFKAMVFAFAGTAQAVPGGVAFQAMHATQLNLL